MGARPRRELLLRAAAVREVLGRSLTVELPQDVCAGVRAAAEARGIQPRSLVQRIVETVIDEDLIDAILDDADEVERLSA